jgi:DNA polymerase III epsilon subunit-like protein
MVTVYADCETGGVLPQHPTIQLAAVAMDGATELSAFEQKIAFNEADCDPEALKMNHYTREAWTDAVSPGVAASRFAAWLRPYSTVERVSKAGNPYRVARWAGYNVSTFDGPRIRALFGTQFCPLEFLARDVLQRVLFHFDESSETPPENFKLSTVAAHFGLSADGAHDALTDARMAARVYAAVRDAW